MALDLLSLLLTMDPKARLTAHQALQHPYFQTCDDSQAIPRAAVMMTELERTSMLRTLLTECETLSTDQLQGKPSRAMDS